MRLLFDTHALLWWLTDDDRLGARARELVADPVNDVIVSVVSLWEIVVKMRIGKLKADIREIADTVQEEGFTSLAITMRISEHLRSFQSIIATHSITCLSRRQSQSVPPLSPVTGTLPITRSNSSPAWIPLIWGSHYFSKLLRDMRAAPRSQLLPGRLITRPLRLFR